MCVSLRHLHRCRHGAKFKSSNGFCPTVVEPLFLKNVSTANAWCSTDQRCMMIEGFKPLYPAMCVSLHHLHRCRHGAKFKSSNGFCPTLYNTNLKFIGYQEKLTPVPYFSSALHVTPSNAVNVTTDAYTLHPIWSLLFCGYNCRVHVWQAFWTSGKCLLARYILFVSTGKWNAEYSCTASCAEWHGWLLENFRSVEYTLTALAQEI